MRQTAVGRHHRFTFAEYLEFEERSTVKHELFYGQVLAIPAATPDEGALAANVLGLLVEQLRGRPCRVLTSDVRIRVAATGLATYPDVSVVCDKQVTDPEDPAGTTLVNPAVIVEVVSPATEAYDRGEKFGHYKQIPSLQEVLHVAVDERRVELWWREGDHWTLEVRRGEEAVALPSLGVELALSEVYRKPLAQ